MTDQEDQRRGYPIRPKSVVEEAIPAAGEVLTQLGKVIRDLNNGSLGEAPSMRALHGESPPLVLVGLPVANKAADRLRGVGLPVSVGLCAGLALVLAGVDLMNAVMTGMIIVAIFAFLIVRKDQSDIDKVAKEQRLEDVDVKVIRSLEELIKSIYKVEDRIVRERLLASVASLSITFGRRIAARKRTYPVIRGLSAAGMTEEQQAIQKYADEDTLLLKGQIEVIKGIKAAVDKTAKLFNSVSLSDLTDGVVAIHELHHARTDTQLALQGMAAEVEDVSNMLSSIEDQRKLGS